MASAYPTSVDVETPLVDGTDYVEATNVNKAYLDVTSTQTMIGASGAAQSHNTDILTQLAYFKAPQLQYNSTSSFDVLAGSIVTLNSGGSIKKLRRNTSTTNVTSANLDTGAMVVGYYYVYAIGNAAATTFTVVFSTSSSNPTGASYTHYALIGWFYNETNGVLDITNKYLGNYKGHGKDVPNVVSKKSSTDVNTTGTSLEDDAEATIRFYSSGRPVLIKYNAACGFSTSDRIVVGISVDASDITGTTRKSPQGSTTSTDIYGVETHTIQLLSAGTHTIQGRYYTTAGTGYINDREITVIEL